MNNPDHISESSKTIFLVKILKFFDADPGWKKFGYGMEQIRIRDKHPGFATLVIHISVFKYLVSNSPECVKVERRGARVLHPHL
jgi:hypothetical protein